MPLLRRLLKRPFFLCPLYTRVYSISESPASLPMQFACDLDRKRGDLSKRQSPLLTIEPIGVAPGLSSHRRHVQVQASTIRNFLWFTVGTNATNLRLCQHA